MAYRTSLPISPFIPDYTELADGNTWTDNDIGKAVKLSGENVVLCVDGDEIYGFIQSKEAATQDGDVVVGVNAAVGREQWVADLAGTLSVGNLVQSSTQAAIGTAISSANGTPVVAHTPAAADVHRWQVVSVRGSGANRQVLIRKV